MNNLPTLRSAAQLRSRVKSWRAFGETVALAAMRPGLHDGHLSLVREAQREADRVLAVLLPEGDEDAAADAARLQRDADLLDQEGADALYIPPPDECLPPDRRTRIAVPGLSEVLCGEEDPAAFDDFLCAMLRLMIIAQPDVTMVGERDWQKLALLRRAAQDLGLSARILPAPTERDQDDVALSAAALAMNDADRAVARRLHRELTRAARAIGAGADVDQTLDAAADALADAGAEVEYLDLRDPDTLAEQTAHDRARPGRVFGAIRIGDARLIDNVPVED
ncbi:pantoate--beta-alanine ligase [Oceanicella actignis]|uniref:pantoate--beta-alanine ligase (AMP-forming) n=1 Tax=Oceanicella actignis TaxID=1189325 RepID=A0A1M7TS33_9RHOB|nr:pantoate--beta-alanine ligase [Oceanicella actignis]SET77679.1 pantoate--beta-alanine ligase [Oceanicella actignis]SHN73423.1 pantoate--beta-alanine ligase [Oceanicella actignis]